MNCFEVELDYLKLIESQFQRQYTFQTIIGQGATSKVAKCQDQSGNPVAIKIVDTSRLKSTSKAYMENEVKILRRNSLNNQNIIKLIDYAQSEKHIFLVLEFCQFNVQEMASLFYKSNKIPEEFVIVIMKQIANGLFSLHNNKIIHRDLKLQNIGVQIKNAKSLTTEKELRSATFKILDFGISKILDHSQTTHSFLGTPIIMAPELLKNESYSYEADIYSFGCCLFKMVTGDHPYFTNKMSQLLKKIETTELPQDLIENLALRDIISRMLNQDPRERITWRELYETPLFKFKQDQLIDELDIQLSINSELYMNQYEKETKQYSYRQTQNSNNEVFQQIMQQEERDDIKNCQFFIYWKNLLTLGTRIVSQIKLIKQFIDENFILLRYVSIDQQFKNYINYYVDFSNYVISILEELIKDFAQLPKQNYTSSFLSGQLKNLSQLKLQRQDNTEIFSYFSYLISQGQQLLPQFKKFDSKNLNEFYTTQLNQNKIIFEQINNILESLIRLKDELLKDNKNEKKYNYLHSQIYLTQIYLALVRMLLLGNVNLESTLLEIQIKNYQENPHSLCKILNQIYEKYNFSY